MMHEYLQILICLQRENKVYFCQIQGKCLIAAMYHCWFWVIRPIHYFPGYWRITLTVEHWSGSNHFHSCHTSRSSSESMPTLLLCSLRMISLYPFFSDLILSQHTSPSGDYPGVTACPRSSGTRLPFCTNQTVAPEQLLLTRSSIEPLSERRAMSLLCSPCLSRIQPSIGSRVRPAYISGVNLRMRKV